MSLLTTTIIGIAVVFGVAYLVSYAAGPWLVTQLYETQSVPDDVSDDLPSNAPDVLVIERDGDNPTPASGSGWPGNRRLLLEESALEDHAADLDIIASLATAEFRTYAYDVRVVANLLRFELLFGVMALFIWSAEADVQQSVTAAVAMIGGVLVAVVVVFYVLYRLVASRIYAADVATARAVGTEALVGYLETESHAPDSRLQGIVKLTPPKSARISRLEAR